VVGIAPAQTGDAVFDSQNTYSNVGALLAKRADGSLTIICTGTLISPRVFLSAAHCTSFMESIGQSRAYVTFDPAFGLNADRSIRSTPNVGTIHTIATYKAPYQNDIGIVLLDKAVKGIAPVKLAPVGFLDSLQATRAIYDTRFLNVGYGSAEQIVVPTTGPTFPFDGLRKYTYSGFHALTPETIHLNQNIHQGESGTGYGDSGGPTFVESGGSLLQVSVVSTGDVPCWSTSVNTRTDTQEVSDFLAPFLALK
jgi:secreted trypsin-like serine protease